MAVAKFCATACVALGIGMVGACESPVAYRPEVEQFQKATAEAASYMDERRKSATDLREDLRNDILKTRRPKVGMSPDCTAAVRAFNRQVGKPAPQPIDQSLVKKCKLDLATHKELEGLFNPRESMRKSADFASAVASYAAALNKVATSADQAGFVKAVDELGDAATSIATSAAKAAGRSDPGIPDLSPISTVVGKATFYYLENKRAQALKDGAKAAHPWIVQGSDAVVRVLYAARFQSIRAANDNLSERIDGVNEAKGSSYPKAADEAIRAHVALQKLLSDDPGGPFKKLPGAHQQLIDAFDDRKRHLAGAIAAAKDLYESARKAREALTKD